MSEYIHKSHGVPALLCHIVFPAKYRRKVFIDEAIAVLTSVCFDISCCHEIEFIDCSTTIIIAA
jgi:REP element-mobilizing transposase RayT